MRNTYLAVIVALMPVFAAAQVPVPTGGGSDQAPADSLFAGKTKVELTQVFIQEVIRVSSRISTLPLDSTGGDVPKVPFTDSKFAKVADKAGSYNEALTRHYEVIIPYADRAKIVEAIIYLRSIK